MSPPTPASLRQGDTFIWTQTGIGAHLWIVASCPELDANDQALIVNVTSWASYADPACVLNIGDHPFIRHKSWIRYDRARLVPVPFLVRHIDMNEPLTDVVLRRVLAGAATSARLVIAHRDYLCRQNLIID